MGKKKGSRMGEAIRKRALSYPDTHEDFPWGKSAFKVKGKTFVFMSDGDTGLSFSVKLPASRDLIDEGFRAVAPKRVVSGLPEPPRLPR